MNKTAKRKVPVTRKDVLKEGFARAEMRIVADHEATKCTLKRPGSMRDNLVRIFQEQCRHCMHSYTRPDSPDFFCERKESKGGVWACHYDGCPYVNGEAI